MSTGVLPLVTLKKNMFDYITYYYETSKTAPDCYGVTAGDFDGAGLSTGIIQFNFYSGTIQPIWKDLINEYPIVCKTAFNNVLTDYNTWVDIVFNKTNEEQQQWGTSITDPTNSHKVIEPWNTYFKQLGMSPEGIARQDEGCQPYFNNAVMYKEMFNLWTRRGLTLLLDICIQSGSISQTVQNLILSDFAELGDFATREEEETAKMQIIANRRADAVGATYRESYRDRKLAIANGTGTVYGGFVTTIPYDLLLEPAFETDVYTPTEEEPETPPGELLTTSYMLVISNNVISY